MKTICLVSTGQPSTNPRLLKEANALAEHGYDVVAVCSYWSDWAYKYDKEMLKKANWKCIYVGGTPDTEIFTYFYTRLRFKIINKIHTDSFNHYILSRTIPELVKTSKKIKADLYIGHNIGALPAVVEAARYNKSKWGFDAEDFHSEEITFNKKNEYKQRITVRVENRYLNEADYLTGSSPEISKAYSKKYGVKMHTILNVFPLSDFSKVKSRNYKSGDKFSIYWFSQTIGNNRGLKQIIEAISLMKKDVELNLRGNLVSSERYISEISGQAESRNVKIRFLDAAPPHEMVNLASEHDLGLSVELNHPLNRDICLTNKIFTYLLAGIPVLLSKTSAQAAIAADLGDAAILVDINKPAEVARRLDDYLSSPEKISNAKKTARQLGETRYNWDVEKEKFLNIINSLI